MLLLVIMIISVDVLFSQVEFSKLFYKWSALKSYRDLDIWAQLLLFFDCTL